MTTMGFVRGERAEEPSEVTLPPLIYLLFLAQAAQRHEDALKSNSHRQHNSHLSKKAAKSQNDPVPINFATAISISNRNCENRGNSRVPLSDQHDVKRIFGGGFRIATVMIYTQSLLGRASSQPPAQATFFFLDEYLDVSKGSIHQQRL